MGTPVHALPRLLFVLTGTGQAGFANRANDLETAARTPHVARMLRTVPAGVAKLEDLVPHQTTFASFLMHRPVAVLMGAGRSE
ncbi:hypothetical protein [Kitasatospora sp. NPDC058218]|uniref:hypothetical protein n=1 Tax=Kitasatospora sp. NPDC058218 TaxID=3346385 RepID=UPI0036DE11CD